MSVDIEISIFGKPNDPAKMPDLADAAAFEGSINYLEKLDSSDFIGMCEMAVWQGLPVVLTRRRSDDFFDDIRSACQDVGLSYIVRYGDSSSDAFSNGVSWTPGMKEEFAFSINGGEPVIEVSSLKAALDKGHDNLGKFVATLLEKIQPGKFEIEDGFFEAWRAEMNGHPKP